MRDFVFRESYFSGLSKMNKQDKIILLRLICEYGVNGVDKSLLENNPIFRADLIQIKDNIDKSCRRYSIAKANGKKGGRPKLNK